MLFQDICNHIENHLHELTPTRPLIIPMANAIITTEDFSEVAGSQTLGEVLSDPAKTELVTGELALIAGERWCVK